MFLRPIVLAALAAVSIFAADWPDWRGPHLNGISDEKGLPEKWDVAWQIPVGSRSAPIVMNGRVYLYNAAGTGVTEQERLMAIDANTGKIIWEYKHNVFQSDIPAHRAGWASPVGDPETGNIYAYGGGGMVICVNKDGKLVWERSMTEEFGLFTTHGGRTVSPVLDGDLLIVSGPTSTWGDQANRTHRFYAFDKRTGDCVWVSTPGGRPYDTTYSVPLITTVNGLRLLIAGAGDGAVHALKPQTGEPVWRYEMAKRGVNTAVVVNGTTAIVSHSEENLDSNEMGLIAGIDATAKGKLGPAQVKWKTAGFLGGYSSPVVDGDRVYQVDNGATLIAFDSIGGRQLWRYQLGTIAKASLVLADGKLYIGTESGKFFILKPHQDKVDVLEDHSMKLDEQVLASAAVSNGRVYVASMDNLYCLGKTAHPSASKPAEKPPMGEGEPAWVQVAPTELTLKPGDKVKFTAKLYDNKGRFLRNEASPQWTLQGLKGTIAADGTFTTASDLVGQAGKITATIGAINGAARARVIPPLPMNVDLSGVAVGTLPPFWVSGTAGKYSVQEMDGKKVLQKAPDETLFKRMRLFFGPWDWANYTVQADLRLTEKRRQLGDVGIVAQRYALMIFGNNQALELQPWQPETKRTVSVPFAWKGDTWYRLKLRVQNAPDGKSTHIQGKAWVATEPEPANWMIDKVDTIPNLKGAAGLFADAQNGVFVDNIKITPNSN